MGTYRPVERVEEGEELPKYTETSAELPGYSRVEGERESK